MSAGGTYICIRVPTNKNSVWAWFNTKRTASPPGIRRIVYLNTYISRPVLGEHSAYFHSLFPLLAVAHPLIYTFLFRPIVSPCSTICPPRSLYSTIEGTCRHVVRSEIPTAASARLGVGSLYTPAVAEGGILGEDEVCMAYRVFRPQSGTDAV